MKLVTCHPFRSLHQEISHMFDSGQVVRHATYATNNSETGSVESDTWQPRIGVGETEQAVLVTAELPGVSPDAVKVSIEDHLLKISGEKNSVAESSTPIKWYRNERAFGKFERAFRLPETIDVNGITASNRDGVLTLTLPKQAKTQPREIAISAG